MWRFTIRGVVAAMLFSIQTGAADQPIAQPAAKWQARSGFGQGIPTPPLTFVENLGQWDETVLFRAGGEATIWLTTEGIVYQLLRPQAMREVNDAPRPRSRSERTLPQATEVEQLIIRMRYEDAAGSGRASGEGRTVTRNNYFIGSDPTRWRTGVPTYHAVILRDVYPGIDVKYYGHGSSLEYDLIAEPGADISLIRLSYAGADRVSLNESGDLVLETDWGEFIESVPTVYQQKNGHTVSVPGAFKLISASTYGFELGDEYDPAWAVIIDPILVFSTYLGGSDLDEGYAVAVDGSGYAYIAGYTSSTDFPTHSPYQDNVGNADAFISKFDPTGIAPIYSTYLGGSSYEWCKAIAVDNSGSVYLTGHTSSSDFPLQGAYQAYNAGSDVFVTKLSSAGDTLVYSTCLGGESDDWGSGVAVDVSGNAYVTGGTESSDFPTRLPYATYRAGSDGFVAKLNAAGDDLIYSTFLGGSGVDAGQAIALDAGGYTYVTGYTDSPDFPAANAYQTAQGYRDAFVTKFNTVGRALIYSTFLGGDNIDEGYGIAVGGSGNAYVTGLTYSPDFPMHLPYQNYQAGGDVFITKLSSTGNALLYSTCLGGADIDKATAIVVDAAGNAYLTGQTFSGDFPVRRPFQPYGGAGDAFVVGLKVDGRRLIYSTFLGGGEADEGKAIALDQGGDVFVAGRTNSPDFPSEGPYQTDQVSWDAFLTRLDANICCDRRVGDVNGSGGDEPSLGDAAVLIDAEYISLSCDGLIDCLEEADFNQSGFTDPACDDITMDDISILIDYLFITGPTLGLPDCL